MSRVWSPAPGSATPRSSSARQQAEGELALDLAQLAGLPRPHDVKAEWQWRKADAITGLRHVVVHSAFKARHDFEVRDRRPRRALDGDPDPRSFERRFVASAWVHAYFMGESGPRSTP